METLKQAADNYIKSVQDRIKQYPYNEEDLTDNFDVNDLDHAFKSGAEWMLEQIKKVIDKGNYYSDFSTKCFLWKDLQDFIKARENYD